MRKLVNIQSDWFIGNENRVHLVPDNAILIAVTINKTEKLSAIFQEYDRDNKEKTRRGVLFLPSQKIDGILKDTISFHPYPYSAFGSRTLQPKAEYTALRADELVGVLLFITIEKTNWIMPVSDYESMADGAALITLIQSNGMR